MTILYFLVGPHVEDPHTSGVACGEGGGCGFGWVDFFVGALKIRGGVDSMDS